jgi:hypothetical protein
VRLSAEIMGSSVGMLIELTNSAEWPPAARPRFRSPCHCSACVSPTISLPLRFCVRSPRLCGVRSPPRARVVCGRSSALLLVFFFFFFFFAFFFGLFLWPLPLLLGPPLSTPLFVMLPAPLLVLLYSTLLPVLLLTLPRAPRMPMIISPPPTLQRVPMSSVLLLARLLLLRALLPALRLVLARDSPLRRRCARVYECERGDHERRMPVCRRLGLLDVWVVIDATAGCFCEERAEERATIWLPVRCRGDLDRALRASVRNRARALFGRRALLASEGD